MKVWNTTFFLDANRQVNHLLDDLGITGNHLIQCVQFSREPGSSLDLPKSAIKVVRYTSEDTHVTVQSAQAGLYEKKVDYVPEEEFCKALFSRFDIPMGPGGNREFSSPKVISITDEKESWRIDVESHEILKTPEEVMADEC